MSVIDQGRPRVRAVQVNGWDGPGALEIVDMDEPVATDGQVLVDVHAAGVSFPDLLMTRGAYQTLPSLPFVLGSEVAGVVRHAPAGSGFVAGDRVVAMPRTGGFADTVTVSPHTTLPLPDGVPFTVAAGLPLNYLTAQFVLDTRARLAAGETVLVHGAAGGVGVACVQHARARGASVVAVVSTPDKAEVARAAGADHVVEVDGFRDAARAATAGRGVDVVVDPVGGDRFTDSLRSLADGGRLVVVGFTAGEIPTVRVNRLLLTNTEVVGAGWAEYVRHRPDHVRGQWEAIAADVAAGRLAPPVRAVPLTEATSALGDLEARRVTGKVVLDLSR